MRRVFVWIALWCCVSVVLYACSNEHERNLPPLSTNAKIDLARYQGAWYVIANIPYFAERGKVATRDVYTLDRDGNMATTFVYRKSFDSPEKTMDSLGLVQPGGGNAYWKVRFLGFLKADYLILDIAPDYSWVLVGQPSRDLGWVLARNPAMDDATYASLLGRFRDFGYDTAQFRRVAQFKEQVGTAQFQ